MSKLEYVKYDENSLELSDSFKKKYDSLIEFVEDNLESFEEKKLVIIRLEESFMWVGKCIRNAQINREQREI